MFRRKKKEEAPARKGPSGKALSAGEKKKLAEARAMRRRKELIPDLSDLEKDEPLTWAKRFKEAVITRADLARFRAVVKLHDRHAINPWLVQFFECDGLVRLLHFSMRATRSEVRHQAVLGLQSFEHNAGGMSSFINRCALEKRPNTLETSVRWFNDSRYFKDENTRIAILHLLTTACYENQLGRTLVLRALAATSSNSFAPLILAMRREDVSVKMLVAIFLLINALIASSNVLQDRMDRRRVLEELGFLNDIRRLKKDHKTLFGSKAVDLMTQVEVYENFKETDLQESRNLKLDSSDPVSVFSFLKESAPQLLDVITILMHVPPEEQKRLPIWSVVQHVMEIAGDQAEEDDGPLMSHQELLDMLVASADPHAKVVARKGDRLVNPEEVGGLGPGLGPGMGMGPGGGMGMGPGLGPGDGGGLGPGLGPGDGGGLGSGLGPGNGPGEGGGPGKGPGNGPGDGPGSGGGVDDDIARLAPKPVDGSGKKPMAAAPPPGLGGAPPPPGAGAPPPPGGGPAPPGGLLAPPPLLLVKKVKAYNGTPMKRFHWEMIPKITGTYFEKVDQNMGDLKQVRKPEFEGLFNDKKGAGGKKMGGVAAVKKKKVLPILTEKRSDAVSIGLARTFKNLTHREIKNAILTLDDEILNKETLPILIRFAPTPEEAKAVMKHMKLNEKNYADWVSEITNAEQFFVTLQSVPDIKDRLELQFFKMEFETLLQDATAAVELVQFALNKLKSSRGITRMFEMILAHGNFMNQGTRKTDCQGFKLTTLSLCRSIKNVNKDGTLLEYFIYLYTNDAKWADCKGLIGDLEVAETASRVESRPLQAWVSKIRLDLHRTEMMLLQSKFKNGDLFPSEMKEFSALAKERFAQFTNQYQKVQTDSQAFSAWFSESAELPWEELFIYFLKFRNDLVEGEKNIEDRKAKAISDEKKRVAKEEQKNRVKNKKLEDLGVEEDTAVGDLLDSNAAKQMELIMKRRKEQNNDDGMTADVVAQQAKNQMRLDTEEMMDELLNEDLSDDSDSDY